MSNINKNYIAVALVAVLFLGTIASYFALDQPDSEEITLPDDRNALIALAQEYETLNVFVDKEIYNEQFFNFVSEDFLEKYGINLIITTGHWSGVQTQLINEKVSGRTIGLYDLIILNDEATARLTEKKLLYSETSNFIDNPDTTHILQPKISGVANDGSVITLWFDTYAFMYNSDEFYKFENVYCLLELVGEEEDDDDDDASESGEDEASEDDDDDEESRCLDDDDDDASESGEDDASEDDDDDEEVEGLLFPNPVESNAGAALVVNAVLYYSDSNYYDGYDNSLESEWPELLNFEIEDEPEMEEMDELFGEVEEEIVIDSILEAFDDEEILVGYFRYGSILLESLEMNIDEEIEIYLAHEGSMKSNVHSSIPFNAENKAGAILLINEILGDEIQTQIAYSYGSFPSANIDLFDNIFDDTQFWIPSDEIISQLFDWPHYKYKINILNMWRVLFEG